jgi:DNA-binding transcriptional regulator YiaG
MQITNQKTFTEKIKAMPLKDYRTLRGVLKREYHISATTFRRWENGVCEPNPSYRKIINDTTADFGYVFFEEKGGEE